MTTATTTRLDAKPPPPPAPLALDIRTRLYIWLLAVNVTCLLLANILGVKLFSFGPFNIPPFRPFSIEHTVGMLPFPITFLLTDLVNEYYGKRAARRMAIITFSMAALAFLLIFIARKFPILSGIPGTATPEAFEIIFGASSVMYIASIIAFLCGTMLDISLFGLFKRLTGNRLIWLRATGSTVFSQIFDSLLVTFLFFTGLPLLMGQQASDFGFVLATAATGYMLKFFIAIALTPAIYAGRWLIREKLGMLAMPPEA